MSVIPKTAAPFFQEYDFSNLDVQTHAPLIIERLLAHGNRNELCWLFETYERQQIRDWLERDGERLLPRRRYELWHILFDLPARQVAERRQAWPH